VSKFNTSVDRGLDSSSMAPRRSLAIANLVWQKLKGENLPESWWNLKGFIHSTNYHEGTFRKARLVYAMNGRTFSQSRRKKVIANLLYVWILT
jgi:hypothetical protein